jgi:hypothetical protein
VMPKEELARAADFDRTLSKGRDESTKLASADEEAAARALRKLARIKAPNAVAAEHQALIAAMTSHLELTRAVQEAWLSDDRDRANAALVKWQAALENTIAQFRRIADQLGFFERWPRPPEPESGDDRGRPLTAVED